MLDQANFSVIDTLRNGSSVEIRAQCPGDRKDLEAALARMSDESLYRRFFGAKRHFSEKEVEHFLNIDFVNHVAVVVVAQENSNQGSWARGAMCSLSLARQRWLSASSMNFRVRGSAPR